MKQHWHWLAVAAALIVTGCSTTGGSPLALFSKPPADDEDFTICLTTFSGLDHVAQSDKSRSATEAATGWKGIVVIHQDGSSSLLWGSYHTVADAQNDLAKSRQWTSSAGYQPFYTALIMRRPTDNPGSPEFDLANAQGDLTLVIGEFYNDPDKGITGRKQYAVDNCVDLRKKGQEAYYYHGPRTSLVTIGAFKNSAYKTVVGSDGFARAVPEDPALKKVLEAFPHLAVNGYEQVTLQTNLQTGQKEKRITVSYTTDIPHKKGGEIIHAPTSASQQEPRKAP